MNQTNKVSLLAAAIALVSAVYMPQASADLKQLVQINTNSSTSFSGTFSGTDVTGGWDGAQHTFSGLKSGVTHARETTANIAAGKTEGFQNLFSLPTSMPEQEKWTTMLVGVGLVSYQVRRKHKGLSRAFLG
jgi:hypothetical protein